MNAAELLRHYERVADGPDAVGRLRRFVLDLAVRGKLVTQAKTDEPASKLLAQMSGEKTRLAQTGKIKSAHPALDLPPSEHQFPCPPGWAFTDLQSICASITDGDHLPPPKADTGIPFLVIGNVRSQRIDFAGCRHVPIEYYEALDEIRRPSRGDLLYTLVGSIGIPVVVREDKPFCVQRHIGILRPSAYLSVEYLARAMESRLAFDQAVACATGIAQKTVSLAGLRRLRLPLPPLAEQHRIVAKVDELMALCDRLEAARAEREAARDRLAAATLARLNAPDPETFADDARFALEALPALTTRADQIQLLRQTILNLAVRGKLVAQVDGDEPIEAALMTAMAHRAALVKAKSVRSKKLDETAGLTPSAELPPSWLLAKLGSLVDPENTISYGVLVPGNDVQDGVPFVRAQDLTLKAHPERPNKTIAPEIEAPYARTRLRGGEILVCVVGSIGKLGIVPMSWAGANIARAVARVLPIQQISKDYLLVVLQGQPVQDFFKETTRTLAQPTLNVGLIEQTPIPVPPLAEQHRIVAKVNELMAVCDQLEASLSAGAEHRSRLLEALLQRALEPAGAADDLVAESAALTC